MNNNYSIHCSRKYSCFAKRSVSSLALMLLAGFFAITTLRAQTEVMAWGNMTGIRIEGQLMDFESSLRVVEKGWGSLNATGKEKQSPRYDREGQKQTVTTSIGKIRFSQVVEDLSVGTAQVSIQVNADADTLIQGVYFTFDLSDKSYENAEVQFISGSPSGKAKLNISQITADNNASPYKVTAKGVRINTPKKQLEILFESSAAVYLRKEPGISPGTQVYIELAGQNLKKGQMLEKNFTVKASGEIDKSPVEMTLDARNPGRFHAGFGGNFRLQNPTDPQVIDFCLDNLRVAFGRVEMPWNFWHPEENTHPIEAAKAGNLNPRVLAAMEMAQKLGKKGMPVIVSDWSAPNWAILGDPRDAYRVRPDGLRGSQLNPEKQEKIYRSITDYLVYLKQEFGVEAYAFSFNESDLGINVRHTGEEHAEFIKGLGAHMASRGLATKVLLGDNSDATTFDFIVPAMNDPETHKYIAAVSFHSWRGCDDETLEKWAAASRTLNVPLIVGEGSTDAAAHRYPEIFLESTFALYEINLYTRILAICQPLSILQWQLTADYSPLTGAGIFRTEGPLRPTQRFWNMKQLASTPEGAFALPLSSNKSTINCAAFGNLTRGEYAIHIVNNGAESKTTITGIPNNVKTLEMYVTDNTIGMQHMGVVTVTEGTAVFNLLPDSFTTLLSQ